MSVASKTLELVIAEGLSVATESLPMGAVGVPYSVQCFVTGGNAPYHWSASDLPEGLSISEDGIVSGTPTTAGVYNPTVTVEDTPV